MKLLIQILNETDVNKYKTWYHVTQYDKGNNFVAKPSIPKLSRLPYEDKKTPRISVTHRWQSAIYMLIVMRPSRIWYIYKTNEKPLDPVSHREELIRTKQIRKNSTLFNSLDARDFGIEAWFLEPTNFQLAGVVDIGNENYLKLRMSMGMGDGGINYNNLKLINTSQYRKQQEEEKRLERIKNPDLYD